MLVPPVRRALKCAQRPHRQAGGTIPTPPEALSAAVERWNAGDLDGYLALYDESIVLHGYSPEPMFKAEVRAFYEGIFSAFGTPKLEFHEVLWDGDACAVRATMTGRHVGEFMGVPATGTEIAMPVITILHFAGDRVTERFSQTDMLGLLVQIGAVPAPA
jgi:predicted ester cyclase